MEETRNTVATENNNGKKEREKLRIRVNNVANFDPCQEIKITSSMTLAKAINSLFSIFDDYIACNLVVQPVLNVGNVVIPILYFKLLNSNEYKNDEGKYFAFKPVSVVKEEEAFIETLNRISGSMAGDIKNSVKITQDGVDVLEEFVAGKKKDKIKWIDMYQVKQLNNETLIAITGIDLYRILAKIYGEVDAEGMQYDYRIVPVSEVGGRAMGSATNWNLTLYRIRLGSLGRAAEVIGFGMPTNYGMPPMYMRDDRNKSNNDAFNHFNTSVVR